MGALLGAATVGAGLMYFLDADRGARRRHLVRDQLVHARHLAGDAAGTTARDVGNRVSGALAATRSRFRNDDADDRVISERVRTELGRLVSHPGAINASADQGRVTLSGPVLAREIDGLLSRIEKVRGVRSVDDRLQVHESAGDVPALQGGTAPPKREFELLQENWTPAARLLTGMAGGVLAIHAFSGSQRRDPLGQAMGLVGLALATRGITNTKLSRLFGLGGGRRGVDVQKTVHIDVPIDEVFAYFTDYQNWPRFVRHVREVREIGEGRQHWVVDGPAGSTVEWDAEITRFVPNELVSWRSADGAAVRHAGILRFSSNTDGSTRVQVQMTYNPPAGAAGHAVAVLLGADPKRQMDDDLARLKTTIETGTPPRDAAHPSPVEMDQGRVQ